MQSTKIHPVLHDSVMRYFLKPPCLILGALGKANMWMAIIADVGVMIPAVINAIRCLFVKNLQHSHQGPRMNAVTACMRGS